MRISKQAAQVKLHHIHKSAARRGYTCTLSIDNVRLLMAETRCIYTGFKFDDDTNSMSFDRVDNTKGYEPGNVIPVTAHANQLKSNFGPDELRDLAENNPKKHLGYIDSITTQIAKKNQKIKVREKQIGDLQKLIEKDKLELEQLALEKTRAESLIANDVRNAEIYLNIAKVLDSNKNLGAKYLTFWQKVKKVLQGFTRNNKLLTKTFAK